MTRRRTSSISSLTRCTTSAIGQLWSHNDESLDLDAGEDLTYSLLSSVVSEGGATYLVSGHRDLEGTLSDSGAMSKLSEQGDELLGDCERVLLATLSGEIAEGEAYDAATGFLLGAGRHMWPAR